MARALLVVVCLAALSVPRPASADIVRLSTGRTITVESCTFEGPSVVLRFRGGGEVRAASELVVEILPDEFPATDLEAIAVRAAASAAAHKYWSPGVIRAMVDRAAARVGLDGKLAHAVVRVESNYQPLAVSSRGAMGLMQIMPVVAAEYALVDPFDPEQNLEAGMRHLRRLLTRFDVRRALAAYNAGESVVVRYGGVPPYRETQMYVQKILAVLRTGG